MIQNSLYIETARLFFTELCPWVRGDFYLLFKRYAQEKHGEISSQVEEFFFRQAYTRYFQQYHQPQISLGKYRTLFEMYRLKIKTERLVLWQNLNLPLGDCLAVQDFLSQNNKILTDEQKKYVMGYGISMPSFLDIFQGLSIDSLSLSAILMPRRTVSFSVAAGKTPALPMSINPVSFRSQHRAKSSLLKSKKTLNLQ